MTDDLVKEVDELIDDKKHYFLFLTEQVPKNDTRGFFLFILHSKFINIKFPKDILKMLWELSKIVKYNGMGEFGPGTILNKTNLYGDFLVLYEDSKQISKISFNDMLVLPGFKTFIFARALFFTDIKIVKGKFTIVSWSFNTKNHPMINIAMYPLNSKIDNKRICYQDGRIYIDHGIAILDSVQYKNSFNDIISCAHMGLIEMGFKIYNDN